MVGAIRKHSNAKTGEFGYFETLYDKRNSAKIEMGASWIDEVRIGNHTIQNVVAMALKNDGDGEMLLGFTTLNQIGPFTIDTRRAMSPVVEIFGCRRQMTCRQHRSRCRIVGRRSRKAALK
jgi:hypothetical protein